MSWFQEGAGYTYDRYEGSLYRQEVFDAVAAANPYVGGSHWFSTPKISG